MLKLIGTTLVCTSGKWSDALGKWAAVPSIVKMLPGTLLPLPIALRAAASEGRIVPNCAWPSLRGVAFTLGTVRSWIIQPSYQPLSLLITNIGSMSVKMSMKARGLFGSVGSPGLGSRTTRTAPIVDIPQFAPVTVNCTWSLILGKIVVITFG